MNLQVENPMVLGTLETVNRVSTNHLVEKEFRDFFMAV
ncbi:putative protein OS=Lysinibacillus sphaericus OX=1421 GN=LYSIN_00993 PE=4 SV=1 [Lysinibacillus sphaericus]